MESYLLVPGQMLVPKRCLTMTYNGVWYDSFMIWVVYQGGGKTPINIINLRVSVGTSINIHGQHLATMN